MKTQMYKHFFGLLGIVVFIFILGWVDWHTGYEFGFFVFYFIPVCIAAWYYGIGITVALSILCALVWFMADQLSGHIYPSAFFATWNAFIRLSSFVIIGAYFFKVNVLLKSEKKKSDELKTALSKIKILESFLSVCCVCKKIRNEDGSWQQIESYISEHSDTKFSHGYCPECAQKAMEETQLIKS